MLTEAPGVAAVKKTLEEGGLPVWLPDEAELNAARVPASWDITSDSLAAWLAGKLGAVELVLVKSCPLEEAATLERLVGEGIVDAVLPEYLRRAGCGLRVVVAEDSARLKVVLGQCHEVEIFPSFRHGLPESMNRDVASRHAPSMALDAGIPCRHDG
jgi:aspartokinase-like uncharacterized kinase